MHTRFEIALSSGANPAGQHRTLFSCGAARLEVRAICKAGYPVVEAYVGEYASGKSENAVNRALVLAKGGAPVTLVDLDLVEPFYTLRPLRKELRQQGIEVLAWETEQTMGLGEAGIPLHPEMRWALRRPGHIILDVGYGVEGVKTLNLLEGASHHPHLKVLAVVNAARPMTDTPGKIVAYVRSLGRVHGLINNTHLGDDTTVEVIRAGARLVAQAAGELGLPVVATSVAESLREAVGHRDCLGHPVRFIKRYMKQAFW